MTGIRRRRPAPPPFSRRRSSTGGMTREARTTRTSSVVFCRAIEWGCSFGVAPGFLRTLFIGTKGVGTLDGVGEPCLPGACRQKRVLLIHRVRTQARSSGAAEKVPFIRRTPYNNYSRIATIATRAQRKPLNRRKPPSALLLAGHVLMFYRKHVNIFSKRSAYLRKFYRTPSALAHT